MGWTNLKAQAAKAGLDAGLAMGKAVDAISKSSDALNKSKQANNISAEIDNLYRQTPNYGGEYI